MSSIWTVCIVHYFNVGRIYRVRPWNERFDDADFYGYLWDMLEFYWAYSIVVL